MRLLNTTSHILKEFTDNDIPQYAILSHRWGSQEITFQDIQNFKNFRDYFKSRKSTKSEGWSKIQHSCERAIRDGLEWIWVDSCCIDKMSSAELSEAINSMFNWYRKAQVCYAYLSDVFNPWPEDGDRGSLTGYQFRTSRWFRRGWTLQELLAPKKLIFFSRSWVSLGTRKDLWSSVSETTGIKDEVGWKLASVAQKMSWASKRETTRTEDRAYSLMGLFGVNMPPLYGEGENAFIRLQLEILRTSDDESIFAWRDAQNTSGGLLARSPDAFQHSSDIKRFDSIHYEKPPYSMTNKGLSMEFSLVTASSQENSIFDGSDTYLAPLQIREGNNSSMFAILLRCLRGNQYRRVSSGELIPLSGLNHWMLGQIAPRRKVVQVKQEDGFEFSILDFDKYKFSVPSNVLSLKGFEVTDRFTTASNWSTPGFSKVAGFSVNEQDAAEETILIDNVGNEGVTAALQFTKRIEDTSASRETFAEMDPTAAEFAEAEAQVENAPVQGEAERFIAIFNVYATRARLGIIVPRNEENMQAVLERLSNWQQGDWMTARKGAFPEPRLTSGPIISAQLIRDQNEHELRSYAAEISFEEASVELPNNEVLPYQVLPRLPELEDTEVHSIGRRNPIPKDMIFRHISGFLKHQELERDKRHHKFKERMHDRSYEAAKTEVLEAIQQSQPPSHSRQLGNEQIQPSSHAAKLEIEAVRRVSVSPILPDVPRMSRFGSDLFSSAMDEPLPPVPKLDRSKANIRNHVFDGEDDGDEEKDDGKNNDTEKEHGGDSAQEDANPENAKIKLLEDGNLAQTGPVSLENGSTVANIEDLGQSSVTLVETSLPLRGRKKSDSEIEVAT